MGIKAFFERLFNRNKNGSSQGQYGPGNSKENKQVNGKNLVCVDCKSTFVFETGEQKFFKMRGLTPPRRCSPCRTKRKRRR